MGLVWGIMRTFLKFGDDEDSKTSAVDALKMWVRSQVTFSFHFACFALYGHDLTGFDADCWLQGRGCSGFHQIMAQRSCVQRAHPQIPTSCTHALALRIVHGLLNESCPLRSWLISIR